MKKVKSILFIAISLFIVTNISAQEQREMKVYYKNGTTLQVPVSKIDSITFILTEGDEGVVINGVRWATRNVDMPGTFAAKPESAGMFYQWNKNIGWSTTDPMVNSNGGTTWDNTSAIGTIWYEINNPCPTGWRIPTKEELISLEQAGSVWTTVNGISGRNFGAGANQVFLPTVGARHAVDGRLIEYGLGCYWSSSNSSGSSYAVHLYFSSSSVSASSTNPRSRGYSVRCVAE